MEKVKSKQKSGKKGKKKTAQEKYPLRGMPVVYLDPFAGVFEEPIPPRLPGIDKGKVIIMPDFDKPLPELDV